MENAKKCFLCKLGFHKVDKESHMRKFRTKHNSTTSRHKCCIKCGKNLYRCDKDGNKL